MVNEDELLTVPEAAIVLGYSPQHTRLLIRRGRLPGIKRGRDWVIPREAVVSYNVRKASIPLFPPTSKRGRPSTANKQNKERHLVSSREMHQ